MSAGIEVITFGCRLNAYESEVMKRHAENAGLDHAVIVNTCAVTSEAVRQARQAIRKARRENPKAKLIVTGCAAQVEPERFAEMAEVDQVVGNMEKMAAETWSPDFGIGETEKVRVADIMAVRETAGHLVEGFEGRARAFVQVQNGCDHRCTFCIIPYGRGPSRSVPMGAVVDEVRRLVAAGHNEVVLTGVDLTSYGEDLPGTPSLGQLTRRLLKAVPELPRLRISSIDAAEADEDLIAALAEEERLMPHLHLSLQAGNDLILKRMKRRHLRADAIRFAARLREVRPDIALGADFIAGFPTETEDAFEDTLRLVDEAGLTYLHVFPFSPRPGTPAAKMPQVGRAVAKARAERLRAKGDEALHRFLDGRIGQTEQVIVETPDIARSAHFAAVRLAAPARPGDILRVTIGARAGAELVAA
ncbi:tRNA (N(6)-L-threonylcarbamoyladenosine(37)-C(2))-methylthiotransferase MtaB [Zavarzinia aquatilis]|uniref:tRNA (N(6)-L-threonylcarbamoyladenosine(37)-C(2))-methylthiotransferase MtaB n=1 Tax=Zavarzinia aquatilis TaxID=2211142 RepID=A0A317EAQ9_9PROT|nr:tRNA (N(6)-L-threonylcarbamoyladenosine(37)-C(2))-methylthiotransferase MtaB [Zavarzinia aquatilis]PWR24198.1 tRNA (N(6)-L-threonylcarbamoyladenosine(37)-C(2))-methylthiotransferase MtaB [Zavarzinia aquatilis]